MVEAAGTWDTLLEVITNRSLEEHAMIRTVVVDDSPDYLEIVCTLLQLENTFEIVGRASNGADAIQAVAHLKPDLLLMDLHMPIIDGLSTAAFLSEHFPSMKIVLMSADEPVAPLLASFPTQGWTFVRKSNFKSEFLSSCSLFEV